MQYKLEVTGDAEYIKRHLNAEKYLSCIHDLANQLRQKSKYSPTQDCTWGQAYELLLEVLEGYSIDPFSD